MLKFKIVNYRGVKRAEIEANALTLIAGPNGAGKSAVAEAMGAVLSGQTMLYDLPKKSALELVRRGEKQGMVTIENDTGTHATLKWPDATLSSDDGIPASASEIAVGLDNPLDWPAKERMKFFSEFLKAQPRSSQFAFKLGGILNPEEIAQLWTNIESGGWDTAYASAKEKGARFKGQWEQITGEKYGSKKAEAYYPASWSADIEGRSVEELEGIVRLAQEWVDAGITDQAVERAISEKEIADLKSKAGGLTACKQKLEEAKKKRDNAKSAHETAITEYHAAAYAVVTPGQDCPHCGKSLSIDHGKIIPGTITKEQADLSLQKKLETQMRVEEANTTYQNAVLAVTEEEQLYKEILIAMKRLDEMQATKPAPKPSKTTIDLEEARRRLATAKDNLSAFIMKRDADVVCAKIVRNDQIIQVLAPEGMRADNIAAAIKKANEILESISTISRWKPVQFSDDCSLWYGDTPYFLCSDSEKYRVRATIQYYIACEQKADIMIFDRADMLDSQGRNGLLHLVCAVRIPAVICMTMKRPEYELLKGKLNGTAKAYWIEDGEVK